MARLIEVQDLHACPSPLTVHPGDALLFHAAGGHVRSGSDIVEMSDPLTQAVLGDNGEIFTPMGSPNVILFLARRPGRATIEVATGGPFHPPEMTKLVIAVEP